MESAERGREKRAGIPASNKERAKRGREKRAEIPASNAETVKKGRTYTEIRELSLEENIAEIAFLISDGHPTDKQMEYAREMVLLNR